MCQYLSRLACQCAAEDRVESQILASLIHKLEKTRCKEGGKAVASRMSPSDSGRAEKAFFPFPSLGIYSPSLPFPSHSFTEKEGAKGLRTHSNKCRETLWLGQNNGFHLPDRPCVQAAQRDLSSLTEPLSLFIATCLTSWADSYSSGPPYMPAHCKECGGSQICEHNRTRSWCKECMGSSICPQKRRKSECKNCGGSQICEHDRRRSQCRSAWVRAFCTCS